MDRQTVVTFRWPSEQHSNMEQSTTNFLTEHAIQGAISTLFCMCQLEGDICISVFSCHTVSCHTRMFYYCRLMVDQSSVYHSHSNGLFLSFAYMFINCCFFLAAVVSAKPQSPKLPTRSRLSSFVEVTADGLTSETKKTGKRTGHLELQWNEDLTL